MTISPSETVVERPQKFDVNDIFLQQRNTFLSGKTLDVDFRKTQLTKLLSMLKDNEEKLYDAIYLDFKKSSFETYETELSMIYHDIKTFLKKLSKWSKAKRLPTNLGNMPGKSQLVPEPLGTSLIIGAWNYPYQLSLLPAVAALGAGNTVIIKPSEMAENTAALMAELINAHFDPGILYVYQGGVEETTKLLAQPFDKIFYTGSTQIGKIVMRAAAENLSDLTLELGGKSPCFVFADAKLSIAAKRLVWGKFLNSGQSCTAPDYLMIEASVEKQFIDLVIKEIKKIYGEQPENSEGLVNIINQRHFERLEKLIDPSKVLHGGNIDKASLFISPTVMGDVSFSDAVMQEEIFGPILPIIRFTDKYDAFATVRRLPKPLTAYCFTSDSQTQQEFITTMPAGSAAINETMMQMANSHIPFGGVGTSGLGGAYHGKSGFDTFSHYKGVLSRSTLMEPPVKYPPYTASKLAVLKWVAE